MQFSLKLLLNLIDDVVIMNVKLYIFFIATSNDNIIWTLYIIISIHEYNQMED